MRAFFSFALATLFIFAGRTATAADKPNIILILADDLGYECIGANGGESYPTPNLDRLAATGVRFEHCYSQPLCTPTRVQLMTGQYNVRNYVRFGFLDPNQKTFAHLFKDAGYSTCIVGKWQLENGPNGPKHFGFDESYLWQLTRRPPRYANPGLEINGREVDFSNGEYGPDLVNNHALDFVTRHKSDPFLLYYPMMLTHAPFQPTPDSPDWDPKAIGEKVNHAPRHFGEMVTYMDKLVGRLVVKLDELKLREKTLILFVGDNGTGYGMKSKWKGIEVTGGKSHPTDAGMRVPLIANQPGVVAAGKVVSDLIDTTDFLPTICDAASISLPASGTFDGRSFIPQTRGQEGNKRQSIYCWYAPNKGNEVDTAQEFARTHEFKLYRDGSFFRVDSSKYTEEKLETEQLTPVALATKAQLQAVLDQYRDVRPKQLDVR